ncbi:MAG TPA: ABC transporter ATP-binding protein [Nitriliruptoraceae bacterium]|nr:ABC transporter ATP-binding protein [Nitriliruptoraceae bacterium]
MTTPTIAVRDLTMQFDEVTALDQLTLETPPGITGLVGANGAGKTTLMRILLGLQQPTTGQVAIHGHDVATDPTAVRQRVGWMPEGDCLPGDIAAAEFVAHSARLAGLPPRAARLRASETLFLVGLEEERFRPIGDFSTGMTQRVKLAQAIVHDPDLVLLDEPASGLDPDGRIEMLALVRRLGEFGIDVLISSHVLSDITATSSWVVLLDRGTLLRNGPVTPDRATGTVVVEVLDRPDALVGHLTAQGVAVAADGVRLVVGPGSDDLEPTIVAAAAATGSGLVRMTREVATLEDEFLAADAQRRTAAAQAAPEATADDTRPPPPPPPAEGSRR